MKKKLLSIVAIFFISLASLVAQPGPGGDPGGEGGGGGGAEGGAGVPLDGGVLSVLLAAGVGYVVSKRKKKKLAE